MLNKSLLEIKNLRKYFLSRKSFFVKINGVRAVEDVSFSLWQGETFGLVGEYGCCKSPLARTLIKLYCQTFDDVILSGTNLCKLRRKKAVGA